MLVNNALVGGQLQTWLSHDKSDGFSWKRNNFMCWQECSTVHGGCRVFFPQKHLCFLFAPCHTFFCVHGGGRGRDIDFWSLSVLSRKAFLTDRVAPQPTSHLTAALLQFISGWMKESVRVSAFVQLCVSVACLSRGIYWCALHLFTFGWVNVCIHHSYIWVRAFLCAFRCLCIFMYVCVCVWVHPGHYACI